MGKLNGSKSPIGILVIIVVVAAAMIVGYYVNPGFQAFCNIIAPWMEGLVISLPSTLAAVVY